MQLIPELGEVMPEDAPERVAQIYGSIWQALRGPFVKFIFRALAYRPDYLEEAWAHVRASAAAFGFETARVCNDHVYVATLYYGTPR